MDGLMQAEKETGFRRCEIKIERIFKSGVK